MLLVFVLAEHCLTSAYVFLALLLLLLLVSFYQNTQQSQNKQTHTLKTYSTHTKHTTHRIKNSLSPRWTETIELDYSIGQSTRFNVGIYDEIRKAKVNKPMGSAILEVGEILGSRGKLKAKRLNRGGTLFCRITAAAPKSVSGTLQLSLRGVGLKNVDGLFGKSDPFFEVLMQVKVANGMMWQPLFRSKHIMNNLNPIWEPCSIELRRLVEHEHDEAKRNELNITQHPLLITVFDWERSGRHKSLGQFETTIQALLDGETPGASGPPKMVNLDKAFVLRKRGAHVHRGRQSKEFGKVVVTQAVLEGSTEARSAPITSSSTPLTSTMPTPIPVPDPPPKTAVTNSNHLYVNHKPTFVDYLTGGCALEMAIAIDFTGSNGDPRKPGTLHFISPDGQSLNDYEKAFTSVGSIIEKYNTSKQFPVYGFGAKFGGVLQHCFQVGDKPELNGLGEALQAYRSVFDCGLTMSGPTVFAEVINMVAARARSAQQQAELKGQQTYTILLILTDGSVTDVGLTQQALRNASDTPLSIVIVGVGRANFDRMEFLDDFADSDPNHRDICQFVEFHKFAHDKSALTRETLEEIPDQLVDYFYTHRGILPLPPIQGSQDMDTLFPDEADNQSVDLNIEYNSEQEIVLGNDTSGQAPRYDDTQYGTAGAFLMVPPVPVPTTTTTKTVAPAAGARASMSTSYEAMPFLTPMSSLSSMTPATLPLSSSQVQRQEQHPVPAPAPVTINNTSSFFHALNGPSPQQEMFHVQVPPGMPPGQQLQVQNPWTKQHLIVTVPLGVPPGGHFAVASLSE